MIHSHAMRPLTVAALFALLGTGCGTLLHGQTSEVAVISRPSGAHAWVDGLYVGVTPIRVTVPSRQPHELVVRTDGYRAARARLLPRVTHAIVALDAMSAPWGILFDLMSGAWVETEPGLVRVKLRRLETDGTHGHADRR